MKKNYNFNFFEPLLIISFWALLFASPLLFGRFEDQIEWPKVITVWLNFLPLLALFLLNRFVLLPKLFFKGKKVQYFLSSITIILILVVGIHFFNNGPEQTRPQPNTVEQKNLLIPPPRDFNRNPPTLRPGGNPPGMRPEENIEGINPSENFPEKGLSNRNPQQIPATINFLILAILLVGFDTGLQISMRWSSLEQEKFKLQKENIQNQLAFLKNQVSPHFFMNTLNNIHALVDIDSEEAKSAIIKLSNLMRHLLYESEGKKTPIKKEVEFIKSYIELMRLRFSDKVKINVEIPSIIPEKSIPPLLFTSLLENAFKHGVSYKSESFIHISLSFNDKNLFFEIENSNHLKETREEASGIGLENTKKRLNLLYKNNYTFTINESEKIYSVNLTIPL
ncbi:sensor histidine kinase [Lutibacter sp.]|uniref:sensor histidine kinase n=1 Tax=Lutibacter sp. TaxID=1925666 RepID=UPI003564F6AA